MKNIIQKILRMYARLLLKKYQPRVIGITGSVGKTSAKQAILAVLADQYRIRGTIKNYNNEIGVPLTIIGMKSGGRSLLKWLMIFLRASWMLVKRDPNFPEMLVLEMGADRPGDIAYLMEMAPVDMGVITAIGEAHYEYFKDVKSIKKEKGMMVTNLSEGGIAILNVDNDHAASLVGDVAGRVVTYGFSSEAHVRASDVSIAYQELNGRSFPTGVHFKIAYEGATVPIFLPGVLGSPHMLAALAGVAVGVAHGMNLLQIAETLRKFEPPCGRMRILRGVKETIILDDTYNASPLAMIMALDAMRDIDLNDGARRYAVLGDMLELGKITRGAHEDIGHRLQAFNVDYLITVGEAAKHIAEAASAHGFDEDRIARFDDAEAAGKYLEDRIHPGDVMLFKGSQGVRLEKAVLEVMGEPMRADKLLCRQDETWS